MKKATPKTTAAGTKEPEMAEVAVEEGGGANYLFVAVEPQIQPAAEPPAKEVAMERASVQRVTLGRADEAEKAAIMMFGRAFQER